MITFEMVKRRAKRDSKSRGYFLTSDENLLQDLLEGLRENEERYSYPSCPCRIGTGNFEQDRDIICPCDYRDLDIVDYGRCYCSLYVNQEVFEGKQEFEPIPERRPLEKQITSLGLEDPKTLESKETKRVLFFCKQCGYINFRDEPPFICPICQAKRDFFKELYICDSLPG
jgi:ferredoxin-thioredoxin reductase catalytic subunit